MQTVVVDGENCAFKEWSITRHCAGTSVFIIYFDTKLMGGITQLLSTPLLQADLQWSRQNDTLQGQICCQNYSLNAQITLQELPFIAQSKHYYTTNGHILEPSSHSSNLGAYQSNDCTLVQCAWSFHINKMTAEA